MHVEFFGLPGSGKTTLRRRMLSELAAVDSVRCISSEQGFLEVSRQRIDKVFRLPLRLLPASAALPLSMKLLNGSKMQFDDQNVFLGQYGGCLPPFLASSANRHMSEQNRQRVIGNLLASGAVWQSLNSLPADETAIFYEESLLQNTLMFVDHSVADNSDSDRVREFLANIPVSDLVIYVNVSIETARRRMISRQSGPPERLRGVDDAEIEQFLSNAQEILTIAREWLVKHLPDRLIVIDNEEDSAPNFKTVREKVQAYAGGRGRV